MGETNNRVKEDTRITLAIPAGILSAVWIVILSIFLSSQLGSQQVKLLVLLIFAWN